MFRTKLSFNSTECNKAVIRMGNSGINLPFDTQQLGLFGSSSDGNKFYPGLDVQSDLTPKPEDFIKVPFRLLSATVVGAGTWKATDFSNAQVLQDSMVDLKEKPVYYDHDTTLTNWVGIIDSVQWGDADGDIPGGINGIISIDGKTNPKIARGILVGAIFSNSVTVEFDWKPSHALEDFDDQVGRMGPDGKMIRRIVTKIHNYHETSLVWLGADPYAKIIDENGNLKHIDKNSTYDAEEIEIQRNKYSKEGFYSITNQQEKKIFSYFKNKLNLQTNDTHLKNKNMELEKLLKEKFKKDSINEDFINSLVVEDEFKSEQLQKLQEKVVSLESESFIDVSGEKVTKDQLSNYTLISNDKYAELTKEVLENKEFAELGKSYISNKRNEVITLYKLSVDNNSDEAMLALINKANSIELDGLLKQYTGSTTKRFSGKCKDCGSTKFEFRSSVQEADDNTQVTPEGTSFHDIVAKFDKQSMNLTK